MVGSKGNNQEATMYSTARLRVGVLLILILVGLVSSLGALLWGNQEWDGLALNLGSEMAGAVVTYALLELFIGRKERREAEGKELAAKKADLIAQMGSQVQDVAIAAAEELRRHGWLTNGSLQGTLLYRANLQDANLLFGANLQGAHLYQANLQGANLRVAKLQGAILAKANLQGANLRGAKLQGAILAEAKLQGADLFGANLEGAILEGADLQRAILFGANLEGAILEGADLQRANLAWADLEGASLRGAKLQGADFDENTTLPDGTIWRPETDMARFTDPDHPDFWRPDA